MSRRAPQSFTTDQQRAISAREREVLVLATAGSGKTEVLIQRVIRSLESSAGQSFRLLVVTFTVKAAEELRRRIQEAIAEELWRVDANTIHGFALDWLRRYGQEVRIYPDVVVFDDDTDRMLILAEYLRSIGLGNALSADLGTTVKPLLGAIDDHRTQHDRKECECSKDYRFFEVALSELIDAYDAALRARGAIDFQGMLVDLQKLLSKDEWVLNHFRTLYRGILVDEGQDLTKVQSSLLRQLAGDSLDLFVVADDGQSIREYAGGAFEHTEALVPAAAQTPLYLRHNFRSASEIIGAAEAISRRTDSNASDVRSLTNAPPGRASFVATESPDLEAEHIASWVSQLMETGLCLDTIAKGEDPRVSAEDIAVIGRTRWTLEPIVEVLTRCRVEHVVQTDRGVFLEEPEAMLFVDCLAFGLNSNDSPAARRVADELRELTGSELTGSEYPDDPLASLDRTGLPSLKSLADLVRRGLRGGHYLETVMEEVTAIGKADDWYDGACALSEAWKSYQSRISAQDRSPGGFLAHLTKIQRTRPTDPGVRVLTIDRAKGLEFKAVALVGARDGLIPHYRADSDRKLEEERRRLYVAMTRASRELMVSWPRTTVDRYGRTRDQVPSRFLVEARLVENGSLPAQGAGPGSAR